MPAHSSSRRFGGHASLPLEIFIILFTVAPVLVLLYFYPALPERVPEYLNLRSEVEVWGRKSLASVFRLPAMAIVMQTLCLLMKHGSNPPTKTANQTDGYARSQEESRAALMKLWDWLRILVAVKLGTSSLDVIFFSFERLRSLTMAVRIISWAAALLGIIGVIFYGSRLLVINRKLKEMSANDDDAVPQVNPACLYGGCIYANPEDPALFHSKYLLNFANKRAYLFIACLLALPLLMFLPLLSS